MNNNYFIKSSSWLLFLLIMVSMSTNAENFSLTVSTDKLRNSKGVVQFSLYNKEGSIPDEKYKKHIKQKSAPIKNGSATITFKDLPKGIYAINILHDENSDGKIEKGFIFPKEGIGFSNFDSIGPRNKPSFKKAQFLLDTNKFVKVKIIYF